LTTLTKELALSATAGIVDRFLYSGQLPGNAFGLGTYPNKKNFCFLAELEDVSRYASSSITSRVEKEFVTVAQFGATLALLIEYK
jgi:hypothetical protein